MCDVIFLNNEDIINNKVEENALLTHIQDKVDNFQSENIVENENDNSDKNENIKPEKITNEPEPIINKPEEIITESEEIITEPEKVINESETTLPSTIYEYNWKNVPKLICSATSEYLPSDLYENFTKGCHWSPDGTCLLVPSEDYRLRIFDLPKEFYSTKNPKDLQVGSFNASLAIKDGGTIYDCCWYPYMDSWRPETCCFLSCSQESPVHLWDAFTGELRATYRAYNQVDEVEAALSAQFVNQSTEIWCGFKNVLRTFDINQPGRQISDIYFKKCFPNVTGLVSCIRENPAMPGLVAFGTYAKCIGLYKDGPICSFKTGNGVTQIEFSYCGTKMYTAVRKSNEFLCWDLRNPGTVLWSSENRMSDTNQRIQFSISFDDAFTVSGGTDGLVRIWQNDNVETKSDEFSDYAWTISKDCVNGVNVHKTMPILATTSGQRLCEDDISRRDNSVRLWWCGN